MQLERAKRILSCARRAITDYSLIEDGDKIAVGISGGKDSLTLLCALASLREFLPEKFEVEAITIDMGLPDMDFAPIRDFCDEIGVPYTVIPTEISKIIFDYRHESNPCALCAKMRRGALNRAAAERGCNKVALGHHMDDAVETFMMNLLNEGRIGCFQPKTYLSDTKVTVIRPLVYLKESDVSYFVRGNALPVVETTCPADSHTDRERMKKMLADMEKADKGVRHRIFTAMRKAGIDGWKL